MRPSLPLRPEHRALSWSQVVRSCGTWQLGTSAATISAALVPSCQVPQERTTWDQLSALCSGLSGKDGRIVAGHELPEVRRGNQDQVSHQGGRRRSGRLAGLQSCQVRPGDQPAHTERNQVYLGNLVAIVVLYRIQVGAQIVA